MQPLKKQGIAILLPLTLLIVLNGCAEKLIFHWYLKPNHEFDPQMLPSPPDYSLFEFWAAYPGAHNEADLIPEGIDSSFVQQSDVDVFYIHPTGYTGTENWNSSMDPEAGAAEQVRAMLAWQASAFNGCCRVFAPQYREATLYSFFGKGESGHRALDLAYSDVERAFDHFINHFSKGRPFIIAGHSQGSLLALMLLELKIDKSDLANRLVVAIVPGVQLPMDKFSRSFSKLKVCDSPQDLHCIISWNTYKETSVPRASMDIWYPSGWEDAKGRELLCVNPLSWISDEEEVPADKHIGAISTEYPGALGVLLTQKPSGVSFRTIPPPLVNLTGARCEKGYLYVQDLGGDYYAMEDGSYHNYDYTLFYMNIRENMIGRTKRFTK